MRAWPEPMNSTPVMGPLWSAKVTKQKPEEVDHTLTFPSSPPVATRCPSGEKASVFMS